VTRNFNFRPKNFPDSKYRRFHGISKGQPSFGTKAMHSVNLDLLRAVSTHHPDGRAKDPHAHHRAEHLANLCAARREFWAQVLTGILQWSGIGQGSTQSPRPASFLPKYPG
jgi:hypothetical protein